MHLNLSVLLGIILNRYFNGTKCIMQIGEEEFVKIEDFPMYVFNANVHYKESERCEGFLIYSTKPCGVFEELELLIERKSDVRYNKRKYLFFLPTGDIDWMQNASQLRHVANVLFIKYVNDDYFELYTHKYVGFGDNNTPVLLDKWFGGNRTFAYANNLFPDKIGNQFGRVLNVIAANYIPYSDSESDTGMELKSIIEYTVHHNMTINLTITDLWGKIYKNWTGTGILGSIVMGIYDVGFSALFALPERVLYSDFTKPTTFSQVSCIVPAPQIEDSWLTPVKVFSLKVWVLVITAYVCLWLTIHAVRTFWCSRTANTFHFMPLSLVGMFVSNPIPNTQVPNIDRLRYVLALVLILTVISSAMYSSRLASTLVAPTYVNEIKTVEDLAKSDILWGELQDDWVLPLNKDSRPLYQTIKRKFRVYGEKKLRQLSLENNFAFGIERLLSGYYAIGPYFLPDVVSNYVVMPEDLYRQYTCMQVKKNSVLLPSLNMFLLRVSEAGLLRHWEGEASMIHLNYEVQKGLMWRARDKSVVMLRLSHVKGAFLLWFVGLCVSFVKFLHELGRKYFLKN